MVYLELQDFLVTIMEPVPLITPPPGFEAFLVVCLFEGVIALWKTTEKVKQA
jgi:hypothetical protein